MKLLHLLVIIALLSTPTLALAAPSTSEKAVARSYAGRIIMENGANNEGWYVDPISLGRVYLGSPEEARQVLNSLALGISNKDFANVPLEGERRTGSRSLLRRLAGRVIIKVQDKGKAYYIHPLTYKAIPLITNADAQKLINQRAIVVSATRLEQLGLSDYNPLLADNVGDDRDKDGFTDLEEINAGTSPFRPTPQIDYNRVTAPSTETVYAAPTATTTYPTIPPAYNATSTPATTGLNVSLPEQLTGTTNKPLTLSASISLAPGTTAAKYEWDFTSDEIYDFISTWQGTVDYSYPTAGTFSATFRVTDSTNKQATGQVAVVITGYTPAPSSAIKPYRLGLVYVYDGVDTYNPNWQTDLEPARLKTINALKETLGTKIDPTLTMVGELKTNVFAWNAANIGITWKTKNGTIFYEVLPGSSFNNTSYAFGPDDTIVSVDNCPECEIILKNNNGFPEVRFNSEKGLTYKNLWLSTKLSDLQQEINNKFGNTSANYDRLFIVFGKLGRPLDTDPKFKAWACSGVKGYIGGYSNLIMSENPLLEPTNYFVDCGSGRGMSHYQKVGWHQLAHEILHNFGAVDIYDTFTMFGIKSDREKALAIDPLADQSIMGNNSRPCADNRTCAKTELERVYLDNYNRQLMGLPLNPSATALPKPTTGGTASSTSPTLPTSTATSTPPIIKLEASLPASLTGTTEKIITLSGGVKSLPTGTYVSKYEWDYTSDGTWDYVSTWQGTVDYRYPAAGTYTATFRATNNLGAQASASMAVIISNPIVYTAPAPAAPAPTPAPASGNTTASSTPSTIPSSTTSNFTASLPASMAGTTARVTTLSGAVSGLGSGNYTTKYEWDYTSDGVYDYVSAGAIPQSSVDYLYPSAGTYTATFRATDNLGRQATASMVVNITSP